MSYNIGAKDLIARVWFPVGIVILATQPPMHGGETIKSLILPLALI